jgi:hypothetical protein
MTATLRSYSRYALGSIEVIMGLYLAFNSAFPLLETIKTGITRLPDQSAIEYFVSGTGVGSSGFWIRLIAVAVGLAMMIYPIFDDNRTRLKIRSALNFAAFCLFTYVGLLTAIFTDPITFFWFAPVVCGFVSALAFLGNSAEVRNYATD